MKNCIKNYKFFSAKIMQTERDKACFKLPRCRLYSAKIQQRNESECKLEKEYCLLAI